MVDSRAVEPLGVRVPKLNTNCDETLSRNHRNFEEHNKILKFSIIIVN
jgi:hypothetical protein